MDDSQLPAWAAQVRQLSAEIEAHSRDSINKARLKRELVQAAARDGYTPAEIAKLINVSQARVGQLLGRVRTPEPRSVRNG